MSRVKVYEGTGADMGDSYTLIHIDAWMLGLAKARKRAKTSVAYLGPPGAGPARPGGRSSATKGPMESDGDGPVERGGST